MDMPLKEKIAALATQFAEDVVAAISEVLAHRLDAEPTRRQPGRPATPRAARAIRRSPADIGRAAERIVAVLRRYPEGLRAEKLRAELGFSRAEMARPLSQMLAEGRARKNGQRRRTVYRLAAGKDSSAARATAATAAKAPARKKTRKPAANTRGKAAPNGKSKARTMSKATKPSTEATSAATNGAAG